MFLSGAADVHRFHVILQELYLRAREDVLDALSDGNEKCDNWRKSAQQQCTDAQDCGKGVYQLVQQSTEVLSANWVAYSSVILLRGRRY